MATDSSIAEVILIKGADGLGFNILGGTNAPYLAGDFGIYVTNIRTGSPAALCNKLHVGDKILEVNNVKLEDVTHEDAVKLFRTLTGEIKLKVEIGARKRAMERLKGAAIISSKSSKWIYITACIGVAIIGYFVYRTKK